MIDELESKLWYQELQDKVDNNILVYQDKRGYFWDNVHPGHLRYFKKLLWLSFTNHLALGLMVHSNANLNPQTIYNGIHVVSNTLKIL